MFQQPSIHRLTAFRQDLLHCIRIRQQQIEMTAARIEKCTAADAACRQDLVHHIFKQNLEIERPPAQTLERTRRWDPIDERLNPRHIT